MKFLLISLFLVLSLFGDELQRIESIVKDISQLRVDYEECRAELKSNNLTRMSAKISTNENEKLLKYQRLLKDEIEKNSLLMAEIEYSNILKKNLNETNKSLNNEINNYEKLLKTKDKKIFSLENRLKEKSVNQIIVKNEFDDSNKFPKLMLKSKYRKIVQNKEKVKLFKASSFRLSIDSIIYDSLSGKEIDKWEQGRSFTSNTMSENWVKITGYFVDKVWRKAKISMWIKRAEVIKR
ncbi:MAG: hypothetical protein U9Q29_01055 [Campylobacterota bacterium]|nr:hypothetical protein [Campylobacterota bacterium]